jgi:Fe-S cluster assembly protein SufD
MNNFSTSAQPLLASNATRQEAWSRFEKVGLPTTSDEVWRYAPLRDFSLDAFANFEPLTERSISTRGAELLNGPSVLIVNGAVKSFNLPEGVTVESSEVPSTLDQTSVLERYASDSFALLNLALAPQTVVVTVAPNVRLSESIALVHETTAGVNFARTQIVLGKNSVASFVEYSDGAPEALVVPLSEYSVGEDSSLELFTCQRLASSAWHIARSTGYLAKAASLQQSVIGLGAHYNRSRNDAHLLGVGASNELRTTFLGSGTQVQDFRTRQYHVAARTESRLLSKGAVAGDSRCVYTGLIEIEKGAKRTDARQTNHNLLLSSSAHADSVPNLDIRENDVMCAHASTVGPLDELQRWYLESRGVRPRDAERLMIEGFFTEMLVGAPTEIVSGVSEDVTRVLAQEEVVQ